MKNGRIFMKYGYARVSTDKQDLSTQRQMLIDYGVEPDCIYSDVISGKNYNRNQLNELLSKLTDGDCLVVTRLDRIGRTASETLNLMNELTKKNIQLRFIQESNEKSPQGDFIRTMMTAFSQYERDLIAQRTKEKLQFLKKQGVILGRPVKTSLNEFKRMYENRIDKLVICQALGISRKTYYNNLKKLFNFYQENRMIN